MSQRQCTLELIKIILIEDFSLIFIFFICKNGSSVGLALLEVTKQVALFLLLGPGHG